MKLGELKVHPPKILLMGEPGTGKSVLAATLGEQAWLYDFERGWLSSMKVQDAFTKQRQQVEVKGMLEKGEAIGYMDTNPKNPKSWMQFKTDLVSIAQANEVRPQANAWIFDSLTSMFDAALRFIMKNGWDAFGAPQIQHWGIAFTELLNMMAIIKTLPGVVVLIAHEQRDTVKRYKDDPDPRQIIEVAVPGKNLPAKITGFFDEVWSMKLVPSGSPPPNQWRRVLQTARDPLISVRSRLQLPDNTDTSVGLTKILETLGYTFPPVPLNAVQQAAANAAAKAATAVIK